MILIALVLPNHSRKRRRRNSLVSDLVNLPDSLSFRKLLYVMQIINLFSAHYSSAVYHKNMINNIVTAEDFAGKTDEEIEMMKLMGFGGFETSKVSQIYYQYAEPDLYCEGSQ